MNLSSLAEFDEAAWPCAAAYKAAYARACSLGRARMAGSRAVICGLARDVASVLPQTIARVERTAAMFADYRVVVYENDSRDGTLPQLQDWQALNKKVTILSEVLGSPHWGSVTDPQRMRQMATYRNRYREVIVRGLADFDFVVVVDTDLLGWSYDGLANTFGHDGWDLMAAAGMTWWHGRHIFYDGFAFRAASTSQPHQDKIEIKAMTFPRGTPPVPVASCFNGLAVYRMAAFCAADYGGDDCEHVVFHDRLRTAGFNRMFFNPSLITLYPDFEILRPQSRSQPWWNETTAQSAKAN